MLPSPASYRPIAKATPCAVTVPLAPFASPTRASQIRPARTRRLIAVHRKLHRPARKRRIRIRIIGHDDRREQGGPGIVRAQFFRRSDARPASFACCHEITRSESLSFDHAGSQSTQNSADTGMNSVPRVGVFRESRIPRGGLAKCSRSPGHSRDGLARSRRSQSSVPFPDADARRRSAPSTQ